MSKFRTSGIKKMEKCPESRLPFMIYLEDGRKYALDEYLTYIVGIATGWDIYDPDDFAQRMAGFIENSKAKDAEIERLRGALHNLLENILFYESDGVANQKDFEADRANAIEMAKKALGIKDEG